MEQKVEQQPEKGDTRSEKGVSTEKKIWVSKLYCITFSGVCVCVCMCCTLCVCVCLKTKREDLVQYELSRLREYYPCHSFLAWLDPSNYSLLHRYCFLKINELRKTSIHTYSKGWHCGVSAIFF
jgi:hypothetical protein